MRFGKGRSRGDSPEHDLPTPAEFANEFWDRENLTNPEPLSWGGIIQHDPSDSIPGIYSDYRYWRFGRSKVTTFLREGVEAADTQLDDPDHFLQRVDGCTYISMFGFGVNGLTSAEIIAIRDRSETVAVAQGAHPDSVVAFELRLREMLGEPKLQILHVMAGVTDGYPDAAFGYVIPTE